MHQETKCTTRLNQRSSVLLEARARELTCVARREPKRKQVHAGNKVRRMKMRSVTHVRPEADVIYFWAGRSQLDSWWRSSTGAGIFRSGDPGVGVIVQSNSAIAGSFRNVSQDSVHGERSRGRVTDCWEWHRKVSPGPQTPNPVSS